MCANGRLYVLSGNLSLLCAIKFVFASLLRLDVTDGFSLGALASRAFIVLEFVTESFPDFDYASPILDFSIFRGQNRHFCPRLVSFEHQTKA